MNHSIDRYLNAKQATMPSISSDGRWLAFISDLTGVPDAGTDFEALRDGYVSVTPLQLDLTCHSMAERLRGWEEN